MNDRVIAGIVIVIISVIGLFLAQTEFFVEVTITPYVAVILLKKLMSHLDCHHSRMNVGPMTDKNLRLYRI